MIDCSRRFHMLSFSFMFLGMVLATVMNSFFWSDVVIHNGTDTDTGWVGRFTKNGLRSTSYYGIMSLMAPAMVAAWLDKDHNSCYLQTNFLYKVDLVLDEDDIFTRVLSFILVVDEDQD
jgi:hypothetical protein